MGFGHIGFSELLLILGICILLFGTKKLRNIGGDLGSAIKDFKKAIKEEEQTPTTPASHEPHSIENKETPTEQKPADPVYQKQEVSKE